MGAGPHALSTRHSREGMVFACAAVVAWRQLRRRPSPALSCSFSACGVLRCGAAHANDSIGAFGKDLDLLGLASAVIVPRFCGRGGFGKASLAIVYRAGVVGLPWQAGPAHIHFFTRSHWQLHFLLEVAVADALV